jgi:pimeloyl-ACP methyl ester carboxylesterase
MSSDSPTGAVSAAQPSAARLELAGGSIGYLSGGSGPPLLLLHGGGGAGQWTAAHAIWARDHRVIAPDHPGFASSEELAAIEGVDDLVYHYLEVMDRLELERPAVVGCSFGGWVAAELAVHSPERIGALALLSPVGLRIPEHPITDVFFLKPQEVPAAIYADPSRMPVPDGPPDVDALLAIYRDLTALARYAWVPFMCNPKLERRLSRISAPTLVLWPEGDRVVPRAHAERYAQLIAGAQLQTIPDCGHALYLERPEEVAQAVGEFLRERAAAGGERR